MVGSSDRSGTCSRRRRRLPASAPPLHDPSGLEHRKRAVRPAGRVQPFSEVTVPFGREGRLVIREGERVDDTAALPASVARRLRSDVRIRAVRDVAESLAGRIDRDDVERQRPASDGAGRLERATRRAWPRAISSRGLRSSRAAIGLESQLRGADGRSRSPRLEQRAAGGGWKSVELVRGRRGGRQRAAPKAAGRPFASRERVRGRGLPARAGGAPRAVSARPMSRRERRIHAEAKGR